MHHHILRIVIAIFLPLHLTCFAQQARTHAKTNPYPYLSTPHTIRSGKGKILRPTAQEEIFRYAREGNLERLDELYEEYGNLDEPLEFITAIYHATVVGNLNSVRHLTCCGAHMTRLFPAYKGDIELLPPALAQDTPLVESLLDVAIVRGHREVALFLAQFIPLWFPNGRGELPLCTALRANRPDLALALIQNNASYSTYLGVKELSANPETALSCARRMGHHDVASFIRIALELPSPQSKKEELMYIDVEAPERKSSPISRWVVLPGLCVLTIGALCLLKMQAPKPVLEPLSFSLLR